VTLASPSAHENLETGRANSVTAATEPGDTRNASADRRTDCKTTFHPIDKGAPHRRHSSPVWSKNSISGFEDRLSATREFGRLAPLLHPLFGRYKG
jgi:hypothetical protein